ncbi:MAG: tetratricopeptide repeat protein [Betaproteobacteria bacterium]
MSLFKRIIPFSLLLAMTTCAGEKELPETIPAAPPQRSALQPIKRTVLSDPEEALKSAIKAYRDGNGAASLLISHQLTEQFPETSWYRRALFVTEQALIQMDRASEADAAMLRVQAEYPELADYAVFLLAEYHFSKGRHSQAAALYQSVMERHPKSPLAMRAAFRRGQSLLESYAYLQAIDAFDKFLQDHPRSEFAPDAGLGLARALTAEAQLEKAVRTYRDVMIRYPGTAADQEAERALTELKASGVEVADMSPPEWYERGKHLSRSNQHAKAIDAYAKFLEKEPESQDRPDALLRTGVALFNLGRRGEATVILEKMARDFPGDQRTQEALYWIGRSYGKLGDWERGVRTLQKILDRFPDSEWADDALFLAGNLCRDAGDMKKAIRFYGRLAKEYPDSRFADSAIWWRAWSYYTAGDYKKMEQALRELISRYPRSILAHQARYWQGRAAEKMGQPSRAIAYYERVLKKGPYTYYGYRAMERKGRLEATGAVAKADDPVDIGVACGETPCPDDLANIFDIDDGPPVWTDETRQILSAQPSFKKTLELMSLDMKKEASQELWALQDRVPRKRGMLIGLSKAFFELGDYQRSLQLVIRNYDRYLEAPTPGTPDDLWLLAYPRGYWDSILSCARKYGQDPYFIAAIVREESRFSSEAISPAGARGLMQVMPATAEWVAKSIKLPGFDREKLFDSDTGITIGTWYIGHLMKQFKGDALLAAAAYNAGPDAVAAWLAKYGYANGERDAFVEAIPFAETRGYVKKVLRNYAEYKRIYGRAPGAVQSARQQPAVTIGPVDSGHRAENP